MEESDPLGPGFSGYIGDACDVATRPVEAGDEAELAPVSKTIGMVGVAALAARAADVVRPAITVT